MDIIAVHQRADILLIFHDIFDFGNCRFLFLRLSLFFFSRCRTAEPLQQLVSSLRNHTSFGSALSAAHTAEDDALHRRKIFALAPAARAKRNYMIGRVDLLGGCPTRRAVLTVADSFVLEVVERIVLGEEGHQEQKCQQSAAKQNQGPYIFVHVSFSFFSNLAQRSSFQSLRTGQSRSTSKPISSSASVIRSQASLPASSLSRHRYTISSFGF